MILKRKKVATKCADADRKPLELGEFDIAFPAVDNGGFENL